MFGKIGTGLMAVFCVMVGGSVSTAAPMPNVYTSGNLWNITFYNDPASGHAEWATQAICFSPPTTVGTSIQGFWFSLSFPDWNGRYYQEGDEVRMTGDYAQDVGHDHMEFRHDETDAAKRGEGHGTWDEWREDGKFGSVIGWGNTRLARKGYCFPHGFTATSAGLVGAFESTLPQFSGRLGARMQRNGRTEATSPNDKLSESLDVHAERNRQTIGSFFDIFVEVTPAAAASDAE